MEACKLSLLVLNLSNNSLSGLPPEMGKFSKFLHYDSRSSCIILEIQQLLNEKSIQVCPENIKENKFFTSIRSPLYINLSVSQNYKDTDK